MERRARWRHTAEKEQRKSRAKEEGQCRSRSGAHVAVTSGPPIPCTVLTHLTGMLRGWCGVAVFRYQSVTLETADQPAR